MDKKQKKQVQFSALYLVGALVLAWLFQTLVFQPMVIRWSEVPYSKFIAQLEAGEVKQVTLTADRLLYTCCDAESRKAFFLWKSILSFCK